MIWLAVVLTLTSAFFHAGWNILLKAQGDPLRTSARSSMSSALVWLPIVGCAWLIGHRPGFSLSAWELACLSAALELLYFICLSSAYQRGELSSVYALARGTAPVLAVVAGIVILGEQLSPLEGAGVAALIAGMWMVRQPRALGTATMPAVLTGIFIAAYSAVDSAGTHLAVPWLYGFIVWMLTALLLNAYVFTFVDRFRKTRHARIVPSPATTGIAPASSAESLAIGMLMTSTYLMILIAYKLAPLAIVSPVRESAIVLVTLWGIWKAREREQTYRRLLGAGAIAAGAVLVTVG